MRLSWDIAFNDEQHQPGGKEEEKSTPKILRRILRFKGPALLRTDNRIEPCFPFHLSTAQKEFLKSWAEERAADSTGQI